jgi:hypothetical protein
MQIGSTMHIGNVHKDNEVGHEDNKDSNNDGSLCHDFGGGGVSDFDDFVGLVHHSIGCWGQTPLFVVVFTLISCL